MANETVDREQLYTALRNADKAGDTAAAKRLAQYISTLDTAPAAPAAPEPAAPVAPAAPKAKDSRRDKSSFTSDMQFVSGNVGKAEAGLAGSLVDLPTNIANLGIAGYGALKGAMGGKNLPDLIDPSGVVGSSEYLTNLMRQGGLITPESDPTSPEGRIAASAIQGATAGVLGGGRLPSVGAAVKQGAAGALGGSAAAGTGEAMPNSPAAQQTAGMLPGLLHQGVARGGKELVRNALVGGKEGAQKVRENILQAQKAGIQQPSGGQVTGNRMLAGAEGTLARLPGAGSVMDEAALKRQEGMHRRVQEIISDLHPGGTPTREEAGDTIRTGVAEDIARGEQRVEDAYKPVDAAVDPRQPVRIDRLRQLLRKTANPVRGAEATSKLLTDPLAAALFESVETDLAAVEAGGKPQVEPPTIPRPKEPGPNSTIKERIQYRAAIVEYNKAVQAAQARADQINQQPEQQDRTLTRRRDNTIERLDRKIDVSRPYEESGRAAKNTLPYKTVAGLRSKIGAALAKARNSADKTNVELYESMYRALSDDVRGSLPEDTRKQWIEATEVARQHNEKVKNVYGPLLRPNLSSEQVTNAAFSGTRQGASKFRQVMGGLTPEQRNTVAAHIVDRLGKALPSQQNAAGDAFSTETFLTNWGSGEKMLHPDAKAALFPDPKTRAALDQLAEVAAKMREAGRGTYNPSGTARAVTHAGMAGGVTTAILDHLFRGNVGSALGIAGGAATQVLGTRQLARAMTSPDFIKWLAEGTKAPQSDLPRYASRLIVLAKNAKDPETKDALTAVAQSLPDLMKEIGVGAQPGAK